MRFPNACLRFFFFFFFSALTNNNKYCSCIVQETNFTVYILFMHCSWDPQPLYSEKNIKNGFHGTIHTFKNYFTKMFQFLVFSFQLYPNGPLVFSIIKWYIIQPHTHKQPPLLKKLKTWKLIQPQGFLNFSYNGGLKKTYSMPGNIKLRGSKQHLI